MKKAFLFFLVYSFCQVGVSQDKQVISGKSAYKAVNAGKVQSTKKIKEVPDLIIKEEVFEDPNSTNIIDGNEKSSIRFKIENLGTGMAKYVTVNVSLKNKMIQGLEFRTYTNVGQINPNKRRKL